MRWWRFWVDLFDRRETGTSIAAVRIAIGSCTLLTLAIAAVWSLEAVNTAIEAVCDAVSTDTHPQIEQAKDVAAAAVLIAALASVVIAGLILGRRLLALAVS